MPWNNQSGGGPWGGGRGTGGGGGGGQSPWGQRGNSGGGGGGQGPTPPDFEDMLRRGQDRMKTMLPGGFGGGRVIGIGILIAIAAWLLTGFYRVEPSEEGVVTRFGEYVRSEGPGLHYHLPYPIEAVQTPEVTRVQRIDIGYVGVNEGQIREIREESLMLTGDENIIDINFTVLWRIANARDYLFNIRESETTVKRAAESAMREVIGQTDIQPALNEARSQVETMTRGLVQDILDSYGAGIEITEVQLQKVDPPQEVIDAFNDVLRARQDQQRLRNEAEAYRNDIIPRARGQAEAVIQEASAYREQVVNSAQGDASRFTDVLDAYNVAPTVTAQRFYLETMEEVMTGTRKVIIDQNSGANGAAGQGVVPYLPLDQLRPRTGGQN